MTAHAWNLQDNVRMHRKRGLGCLVHKGSAKEAQKRQRCKDRETKRKHSVQAGESRIHPSASAPRAPTCATISAKRLYYS